MTSSLSWSLAPRSHAVAHFSLVVVAVIIGSIHALVASVAGAHEGAAADALGSHGVVSFYVAMVPALPGVVGNLLAPRALGVRAMALPRLGRAGVVLHALGLVLAIVSMGSGGARPGWLFVDAYDVELHGDGALVLGASLLAITLAGTLSATSLLVTIARRVAGDRKRATHGLAGLAIGAAALAVTAPAMVLAVMLVLLERTLHLGVLDPRLDGSALLLPHLVWFHVQSVLAGTLAASIGIADEILVASTTDEREPASGRFVASLALLALGHSFASALDPGVSFESDFGVLSSSAFRMVAAAPLLGIAVRWLRIVGRGARFTTSSSYASGMVLVLALAAPALVALSVPALGSYLGASSFSSGTLHLVASGAVLALLAAAHAPGSVLVLRGLDEVTGRRIALMVVAGVLLSFVPMLLLGARGMPSPMHLGPRGSLELGVSQIGSWVLVLGLLLGVANLLRPWLSTEPASA